MSDYFSEGEVIISNQLTHPDFCLFSCDDLQRLWLDLFCYFFKVAHGITFASCRHEIGENVEQVSNFISLQMYYYESIQNGYLINVVIRHSVNRMI